MLPQGAEAGKPGGRRWLARIEGKQIAASSNPMSVGSTAQPTAKPMGHRVAEDHATLQPLPAAVPLGFPHFPTT